MGFDVLSSLPLLFVVAGLGVMAASSHLSALARRNRQLMDVLLHLEDDEALDPLDLPRAAWPTLAAGGLTGMAWSGQWFGQSVSGRIGKMPAGGAFDTTLRAGDDVHLTLRIAGPAKRGESRLFAEHLTRVFVLLLEARVRERSAMLSAALAERARLTLYLQHDMRNLAQWVVWVAADFADAVDDADLDKVARRLRDNAGIAGTRAQRLTAALGASNAWREDNAQAVALHQAIEQAARLAGLRVECHGEATVWASEALLHRALDNLLGNLAGEFRRQPDYVLHVYLSAAPGQESTASAYFASPWLANAQPLAPEKLFEPFASGRPGGLGLGLYQARKSLREAGGDLFAQMRSEKLYFFIYLPTPPADTAAKKQTA